MLPADINEVVYLHCVGTVTDATSLVHAGLDSLEIVRIAAELSAAEGEIELGQLAAMRTVGDLKGWLSDVLKDA